MSGEGRSSIYRHLSRADALGDDLERITGKVKSDYTEAARVEIGRALEGELKGRAGNPNFGASPIPENFPELRKGDTRDLAAKAAGFGKAFPRARGGHRLIYHLTIR